MNIGIIGSGKMGGNLARLWANAGYTIYITSNNIISTKKIADSIDKNVIVTDTEVVITKSDVVLLAFPYEALSEISKYMDLFYGKIIIDCINPLTQDALGMLIGFNTSAGEETAKIFKGAKVVKAFNVIASPVLENDDVRINSESPSVFYCGDDKESKDVVGRLISDIGFEPVDSGELKNARYLEPMAELLIQLAFGGLGANIGFKLLK
jgi:predicted dinucleotide-binding enzyme